MYLEISDYEQLAQVPSRSLRSSAALLVVIMRAGRCPAASRRLGKIMLQVQLTIAHTAPSFRTLRS
jgi:hypothetical protein